MRVEETWICVDVDEAVGRHTTYRENRVLYRMSSKKENDRKDLRLRKENLLIYFSIERNWDEKKDHTGGKIGRKEKRKKKRGTDPMTPGSKEKDGGIPSSAYCRTDRISGSWGWKMRSRIYLKECFEHKNIAVDKQGRALVDMKQH